MGKDQATTTRRLGKIASTFNSQLAGVRAQLKRDRKHSERSLGRATSRLYRTLARQQRAQLRKNAAMEAATRRMRLDMMDQIRRIKTKFRRKVLKLGKVVAKNDKKANKAELKSSLRTAIQKGERRAQAVLKVGKAMNKKTKMAMQLRLKAEVSKLAKETHSSLEAIALQSKAARAELKKEMMYAIRSAASVA